MHIYMAVYWAYFCQYLKKKSFYLYLLLVPFIVIGILFIHIQVENNQVQVGYAFEGTGVLEDELEVKLKEYQDITFIKMSLTDLYPKVMAGDLDLAYVFPEDMEDKIHQQEFHSIVEVIMLEGAIYHDYIKEDIYGILYDNILESIALEYLSTKDIYITKNEIREDIAYRSSIGKKFQVELTFLDNTNSNENHGGGILHIWKSFLCLYLLVLVLVTGVESGKKKKHILVPYMGEMGHKLSALLPIHTMNLVSITLSLGIIAFYYPMSIAYFLTQLLAMATYYISIILCTSIAIEKVKGEYFVLCMPYICIFILVTHPIIWDVTKYTPWITYFLRALPSYQLFTSTGISSIMTICIGIFWYICHKRSLNT